MVELRYKIWMCCYGKLSILFTLALAEVQCESSLPSRVVNSHLNGVPMHAGFKLSKRRLLENRLYSRSAFEAKSLSLRGGGGCLSCFPKPTKPSDSSTKTGDSFVKFTLEAIFNASELNGTKFTPAILGSHECLGSWMPNQVRHASPHPATIILAITISPPPTDHTHVSGAQKHMDSHPQVRASTRIPHRRRA